MTLRQEYLNNLPKKISSAGALFFNESWEVLLLETEYKDNLEIPGGIIEQNESPKQSVEREIKEELGIDISVWELLLCEHQILDEFECYAFMFDWGVLTQSQIDSFHLWENEIKQVHFLDKDTLWDNIKPQLKNRIQNSIESKQWETTLYYETDYR